jgi:SAM-dependent methyltransferase
MQHSAPDFRRRAQLAELMDQPCSREELRACLRDLAWTNRWTMAYRPVLNWLNAVTDSLAQFPRPLRIPLRILDVGCGYGDTLRRVERWAESRGLGVELYGIDLNADATALAAEASPAGSRIHWIASDVFAYSPSKPVHLVVSSLFTHHLGEQEIVRFIQWMEVHAGLGWFIHDLSRSAIPYHAFRVFSKLAGLHRFVQHDGPVSIARSFIPQEWQRMCAAAGLGDRDVRIRGFKPARLCVERRKAQ